VASILTRSGALAVFAFACLTAAAGQAPAAGAAPPGPRVVDHAALRADLDRRWERDFASAQLPAGYDSQNIVRFVLDGAEVGYDARRLEQVLGLLERFRDTKAGSRTQGNHTWYLGEDRVNDTNAVEFSTRSLVLAWHLLGGAPQAPLRRAVGETIRRGVEGIRRHAVNVEYTNIALMRSANLVLAGELLGDRAVQAEGLAFFKAWRDEVKANGVREYLSPTYTQVDLENLGLLLNLSAIPEVREQARVALDLLWLQTLANWYEPSSRLGGTHSRDYDRLYGHAGLDRVVGRFLGREADLARSVAPLESLAWYEPPAGYRRYTLLAKATESRTVVQRFGPRSWATQWVGRAVSLGTSSDLYWNMDKTPVVVNLGRGEAPVVSFWMDGRGDYYGQERILEKSGHLKSLHLMPQVAAAQREREALVLARGHTEGGPRLESTISLPADARYMIDDEVLAFAHKVSAWKPDFAPDGEKTFVRVVPAATGARIELIDRDPQRGVGLSQTLPAREGSEYEIKVKGEGGAIFLYLNFYSAGGQLLGGEHNRLLRLPTGGFAFEAPLGARQVKAWIYSTSTNLTEVTLDDVQVWETPPGGPGRQVAGFDFEVTVPYDRALKPGQTLFIQRHGAACGLRVVAVEDVDGRPVDFHLRNDGLAYGALRLTAVQSSRVTTDTGVTSLYVQVTDEAYDEASFAAFRLLMGSTRTSYERLGGRVETRAASADGTLSVRFDGQSRTIDPSPARLPILAIDGRDLGSELLAAPGF
jgi:hypothetical protein